jgi:hypothetical protein
MTFNSVADPTWIQFFRPRATRRIEFSARLLPKTANEKRLRRAKLCDAAQRLAKQDLAGETVQKEQLTEDDRKVRQEF